jgi:uncharacterized protein (TIGR03083 family)
MSAEIQAEISAERRELATVFAEMDNAIWDGPTLCAGWRPREVLAHMTMPFRLSKRQFVAGMAAARGNFDRMANRYAHRVAAELTPEQLVDGLWENADFEWKPPGGGLVGALSHDVIHGLDITTAAGLERHVPFDRLRIVLDAIEPRQVSYFGVDLDGIRLQATDVDWSYGSGAELRGPAQDLLLVLCGRTLPDGHITGEPAERFARVS